ncbi:hypothetical protein K3495_g8738 [Podosphaera aphanis]|nr:hypothetical protein K3495_g8738 [Podosphaera aphanis]
MSSHSTFNNSAEFIAHLHEVDDEHRATLISDLFQESIRLHSEKNSLSENLLSNQKRGVELETLMGELRRELSDCQRRNTELLQSSAVGNHKLAEAEIRVKELSAKLSDLPGGGEGSGSSSKSELFKIDERFSGEDKTLYPSFKKQIRIALALNSDRYKSLQSQISLIYQNLGPGPKSFLERHLSEAGVFNFTSLSEVWDVLDVSYSNPNEEEEARDALSRIRQGTRPFGAFLSEFQRLQNLSGITDCKVLITYIRGGVCNDLRSSISHHQDLKKSYTLDEFVALCKDCALRLDLERPQKHHPTPRGNLPIPLRAQASFQPAPAVASGANVVPLGGDPMVLDQLNMSHLGPDGHLTPEERKRRFRFRLCMRCGKPGHRANTCKGKDKEVIVNQLDLELAEDDEDLEIAGPSSLNG